MNVDLAHFETFSSYIPIELMSAKGFLQGAAVILIFLLIRYFTLVGLCDLLLSKRLRAGKIDRRQKLFEIKWSLSSSLVFAFSGYLCGLLWQQGLTAIYLPLDKYGWWYLPVSFLLYALIHEFYFYFSHLLLHRPFLFRHIHAIHHHSKITSPWASFSFHPVEALVHAIFLPMMICLVPIHPLVFIAYLVFMTLTAISNHLGAELIPWPRLRSIFISGTHHSIHHRKIHFNYGLYFCFLDRWLGTEKESL